MPLVSLSPRRLIIAVAAGLAASAAALLVVASAPPLLGAALAIGLLAAALVGGLAPRRWSWRAVGAVAALLGFLGGALFILRLRFGGGERYPDLSTAPLVAAAQVEAMAELEFPPGNLAVAASGRVFFNYHPFAQAHRFAPATVFELVDGKPQPFPDAAFQARYQGVFGMTVDRHNRLWFIEPASLEHARTRLLAFDLTTAATTPSFEFWFPEGTAQFAQDLRISPDGKTAYLADTGLFRFTPAHLLVLDLEAKTFHTVLQDDPTARPQPWIIQTPQGPHKLAFGLITFVVGLDGIELSRDGASLYYGAMNHDSLYTIPTSALRDQKLSAAQRAAQIVKLGPKPLSDGLALDGAGRVLITDIEHGGLARLEAGKLTTLVKHPRVIWADGVATAPDGAIWFTDSAIPAYIDQLARPPSLAALAKHRPYHLYRFRAE